MSILFSFSAYQIEARHSFLEALLGKVKPEETESLETARTLVITITSCLCVFSLMEAACYYLFSTAVNNLFKFDIVSIQLITTQQVHPWRKIIQEGNIVPPQETGILK